MKTLTLTEKEEDILMNALQVIVEEDSEIAEECQALLNKDHKGITKLLLRIYEL